MYKKVMRFLWRIMTSVFVIFDDVPDTLVSLFDGEKKVDSYLLKKQKIILMIRNVVIACWVGILIVVLYSAIYIKTRSTFYVVSANVEQVTVSPYQDKDDPNKKQEYPVFKFSNALLYSDCSESAEKVSGTLYPDSNSYIEFIRIQKGELIINIDSDSDSVGGFIHDPKNKQDKFEDGESEEIEKLTDCATVKISMNENDSFVFPIKGDIRLGGDIKHGSEVVPILYSGKVSIIDKAYLSDVYYTVGPFDLEMGDVFRVEDAILSSSGFVQVDEEKGINVIYSSKGSMGYIKKYQTENIEIKNGFWTKIYNDQSLIVLWFLALFAFASCKASIRINLTKLEDLS